MTRKKLMRAKQTRMGMASEWWKAYFRAVRRCYACGHPLKQQFVPEEGRTRRVCRSCQTITYLNPKPVAGLIPVTAGGRVALLKRNIEPAKGRWSYPAGFQEMGESIEAAAARETREEIGIKADVQSLLGVYSYPRAGVVTIVFLGRVREGEVPKTSAESKEVALLKPREIPWRRLAFRSVHDALRDWTRTRGRR